MRQRGFCNVACPWETSIIGDKEHGDAADGDTNKCGDTAGLPFGYKCGGANIGFYKPIGGNGLFIESAADPILPVFILTGLFSNSVNELLAARRARLDRYLPWL